MLRALYDEALSQFPYIRHGFFTRQGGVSTGLYAGLNCAFASKDELTHIQENRRRVCDHLRIDVDALCSVKNVHRNTIAVASEPWPIPEAVEADAMVAKKRGLALGSDSADCPIVLFADPQNKVIGLAHAGWKSAITGILEKTIEEMKVQGAKVENIYASIGPCILQPSYEVGAEFVEKFLNECKTNAEFFKSSHRQEHHLFDLLGYVKHKLIKLKLKHIWSANVDTYSNEALYFSYRRTTHRNESDFGGHFACIYLD